MLPHRHLLCLPWECDLNPTRLFLWQVVYYRAWGDMVDTEGHGTHCAGSAVGALEGWSYHARLSNSIYNPVALRPTL